MVLIYSFYCLSFIHRQTNKNKAQQQNNNQPHPQKSKFKKRNERTEDRRQFISREKKEVDEERHGWCGI